LSGLTVREHRALEAGDVAIAADLLERMVEVFRWPQGDSMMQSA
jgi:hypothetical protein